MAPAELTALRERQGLSKSALAKLLGRSFSAVYRWESGVVRIPPELAVLMRLMADKRIGVGDIAAALAEDDNR
jgi:transcriptional regulator with XRE-family HTH domain